ncbi:hypothetical protein I308_102313 [Cryptococcus tetragattii IND107]|uniref:Dolichyldiphosphatase n=1 Tax=Cryptococcus tetragattii IND107 TaxID=1296105 RepID=A0ABR3BX11_9TREE
MSLQLPEAPLPPLKSFSLTHILYDPSHPLSIPLTLLSLSPIFLFVSYFTLLIFTRQISIALLASGQLANEVLSWVLKRLFKGERPYIGHSEVGAGYGMPSSHSQAAGFLVAWGIGTRVYVFGLLLWSVGVSYSRFHLHYHSPVQIVAGYLAGLAFGAVYFTITEYYPLRHPRSSLARLRSAVEYIWRGAGGVGGWELGGARGGWGEGWAFVGEEQPAEEKGKDKKRR